VSALPLLIITVLASGGPPGTKPFVPENGMVYVRETYYCHAPDCIPPAPVAVAHGTHGRLRVRLRPGKYSASATLGGTFCESRDLHLRRGHITRFTLHCQIP
jgi:hypothetical protein